MSPSSYANTNTRRAFVKPTRTPVHRRIMINLRRLSSSRIRLSLIVLVILVVYFSIQSRLSTKLSRSSATGIVKAILAEPTRSTSNSIPFAPTQIRRSSATVIFEAGTEQEIYIAPLPKTTQQLSDKYVNLWEEGAIKSVIIPIGGSLSFSDGVGEARKLWRVSSNCQKGECKDMANLNFKQDVAMALRQMSTSGKLKFVSSRLVILCYSTSISH